jgi:hypothetical protein
MSDPLTTRLDRRREELGLMDEMRHLRELYELMYLVTIRNNLRRSGWLE